MVYRLLILGVLITTLSAFAEEPAAVQVGLYCKGEVVEGDTHDVLIEISNTSDQPIEVWKSPVNHDIRSDNSAPKPAVPNRDNAVTISVLYQTPHDERASVVTMAQGSMLVPFEKISVPPRSVSYLRMEIERSMLGNKTAMWVEATKGEVTYRSNNIVLRLPKAK